MECFDTQFEMVNRLEFVSEWDYQTVSTVSTLFVFSF